MISAIRIHEKTLQLLDQRKLPHQEEWIACNTYEDVASAIEDMIVRGAPAIGCAAAYGYALAIKEMRSLNLSDTESEQWLEKIYSRLAKTRPTAVNLFYALDDMKRKLKQCTNIEDMHRQAWIHADKLYNEDYQTCKSIGDHGAQAITGSSLHIMTHCNAGGIATTGYGTALGVIQSLYNEHRIAKIYVNETRPWLQGARLTSWELMKANIPCQLAADSSAGIIMQQSPLDAIVVGADRIAMNGDTANKIGTYNLAVLANYHQVPFYIAAPFSTFDPKSFSGQDIPIETRPAHEVTHIQGVPIAPHQVPVYNPSFDITPHQLITGYITEHGVLTHDQVASNFQQHIPSAAHVVSHEHLT